MKIIVSTLNSKFTHTSLSIRLISNWLNQHGHKAQCVEYTINSPIYPIVGALYKAQAEVYIFSLYIWNGNLVRQIASELKSLMPKACIVFGGPEVSFDAESELEKAPYVDYIIRNEGEIATESLMRAIKGEIAFSDVLGLTWRDGDLITSNSSSEPVKMDDITFPYPDIRELKERILYYESSRGCPYNCSYCLSSSFKGIRFKSLENVKKDVDQFIQAGVRQVKWIDRTFNADAPRALALWQYLAEQDDGKINHHFEITAELLRDEDLAFLSRVRKGLFQFEIGVQTTMPEASEAVNRRLSFDKLEKPVHELQKNENIHVHLDLIAGLPYESYERFLQSFDEVYGLNPQVLQLGFLKLIKGSGLRAQSDMFEYISQSEAPYEVMANRFITFDEMLKLKDLEEVLEQLHNSKRFLLSLDYLMETEEKPSMAFTKFAEWLRHKGCFDEAVKGEKWYSLLWTYTKDILKFAEDKQIGFELSLLIDYMASTGKQAPTWLNDVLKSTDGKAEAFEITKTGIFETLYPNLTHLSPKERIKKIRYNGIAHMPLDQLSRLSLCRSVSLHKENVALSESDCMIIVDLNDKHPVTERYRIDLFMKG